MDGVGRLLDGLVREVGHGQVVLRWQLAEPGEGRDEAACGQGDDLLHAGASWQWPEALELRDLLVGDACAGLPSVPADLNAALDRALAHLGLGGDVAGGAGECGASSPGGLGSGGSTDDGQTGAGHCQGDAPAAPAPAADTSCGTPAGAATGPGAGAGSAALDLGWSASRDAASPLAPLLDQGRTQHDGC